VSAPLVASTAAEVEALDVVRRPAAGLDGLIAALARVAPDPSWDAAAVRADFERLVATMPVPADVRAEEVAVDGRAAQLLTPAATESGRVALYLHGGAYTIGSPSTVRGLASRFAAAARCPALVVDYRLTPEHTWPAPVEDALAALAWIEEHLAPSRLVVAGDSAGAGLALSTGLRAGARVDAVVAMSPWTDLRVAAAGDHVDTDDPQAPAWLLERAARALAPGAAELADASPLASPDLSALPPTLVQAGAAEGLLDDSLRFAGAALEAGAGVRLEVWPGQLHVFQAFAPRLEVAGLALAAQGRWLDEVLAAPTETH
jgi:epsilon-lactone hydrolase